MTSYFHSSESLSKNLTHDSRSSIHVIAFRFTLRLRPSVAFLWMQNGRVNNVTQHSTAFTPRIFCLFLFLHARRAFGAKAYSLAQPFIICFFIRRKAEHLGTLRYRFAFGTCVSGHRANYWLQRPHFPFFILERLYK